MSKNKLFIVTFLLLFVLSAVVSAVFFLESKKDKSGNKLLVLENSLAKETEHKQSLENARLWCEVSKEKIAAIKQNLNKGLNDLDKEAGDYIIKKENYRSKLNNIDNANYWEKCENNYQSQLDASNIRIEIINKKIRLMRQEF